MPLQRPSWSIILEGHNLWDEGHLSHGQARDPTVTRLQPAHRGHSRNHTRITLGLWTTGALGAWL